ncbi:MAG: hypothetical protein KGS72_05375 [Cyanobacteria bacterium REEB67]|nr:hypothetical protein [Cyanobacteria bacterium REEB67]
MDSVKKLFDNNKVKILGGDIAAGDYEFNGGVLWGGFDQINLATDLTKIDVKTEESAKNIAQTLGWAFAGSLLGPLGILAGLTLGGNHKQVCVLCELKDDRKFLAVMDSKIYQQLMALSMSRA